MSKRYRVVEGSESGHCCFAATVVDTQTPHPMFDSEHYWVCECFDRETAQKIADALNAAQPAEQPSPDASALVAALEELVDLVEAIRQGEHIPDSFTTQPARIALAAHRKGENRE